MNLNGYMDLLRGRGLADKTISEYCKYVRRLHRWCLVNQLDPDTIPPHRVRDFADSQLPRSWASRKQARTALAHYWRALGRDDEPWVAIPVPRKPRPAYTGLSPADASMLKQAAVLYGSRPGLAVLCLLYTGARPSEVAGFRAEHLAGGMARWWRPKTQDWQAIPLHPALAEHIPTGSGPMFVGNNGREHVSGTTVWSWCRKVARTVGMDVTPKQLRSTAGMMVLEGTGDIDAAASFLGHRSVDVTRAHYTRTSQRRLDEAVHALDAL